MSTQALSAPTTQLISELFDDAAPRRAFRVLGWSAAIGVHVLAAGFALQQRHVPAPALTPLEVELAAPEPPPPPPVDEPTPEVERVAAPTTVARAAAAAPPAPAHVGALLTAKADPTPTPGAEEPVDFTNDPSALGFGSGIVAIGGTAKVGLPNARLSTAPPSSGTKGIAARPAGDAVVPVGDLSRKPGLGESDPCRGYFPGSASDDVASAAVMVTIGKSGAVSSVRLLSESPAGQGFGAAARTCMSSKRFSPGLDHDGNPAATAVRVNIRFARRL